MPLLSKVHTLSETTPTQIVDPSVMPQKVTLHNMNKSSNEYVFIGGPTVSVNNAIHIDPGETVSYQLGPLESLHAVSEPGGLIVGVMINRQD